MTLGEKLRLARIEAGLSQRRLCGDTITRNMLSQIENGTAKPSMTTLQVLAQRLGKPVSYFLQEDAVDSPNHSTMTAARQAFDAGDDAAAANVLKQYTPPDELYDREHRLLSILTKLNLAQTALTQGRCLYARELLEAAGQLGADFSYYTPELERRRLLLLSKVPGQRVSLPSLDEELLLRAQAALTFGDPKRCSALLEAVETQSQPQWHLLRGQACLKTGDYAAAVPFLLAAEAAYPKETAPLLEHCFRELGDYQQAYFYACKQRR